MSHPHNAFRLIAAAVRGAAIWTAFFAVILVVVVVAGQAWLFWRQTGIVSLVPDLALGPNQPEAVRVVDATPSEAAAIRAQVANLAYRIPPNGLTFKVTTEPCPQCGGEYEPALGVVLLQRSTVDDDGPVLQHAVAHEVGHYVDDAYLDDNLRARFRRLRDIPPQLSWLAENKPWQDRPDEDFAEVFAVLNMTTAGGPIQTSYGPVGSHRPYIELLQSAGVRLDRPSARANWRLVLRREESFASYVASEPRMRLGFWALLAIYAGFGAVHEVRKVWHGPS